MFSRTRAQGLRESRRQRCVRLLLEDLEARTAPTANIFSDVATESALRADILAADSNSFADNIIDLTGSITLNDTTAGQLESPEHLDPEHRQDAHDRGPGIVAVGHDHLGLRYIARVAMEHPDLRDRRDRRSERDGRV